MTAPGPPRAWLRAVAALGLLPWVLLVGLLFAKAPGGFGVTHPRFWSLQVLPWALTLLGGVVVVALWRGHRTGRVALLAFVALAVGMTLHLVLRFPSSRPLLPVASGGLALVTGLLSLPLWRLPLRRTDALVWALTAVAGAGAGESLRAPDASTSPAGVAWTPAPSTPRPGPPASLLFERAHVQVTVDPMFVVDSRSPDRFWTALAPPGTRHRTTWEVTHRRDEAETTQLWWSSHDGEAWTSSRRDAGLQVEARVRLREPIYTHLATWAEVVFDAGGQPAHVRFDVCGDRPIEVRVSDYPEGRPVRFAYVDADHRLRVVEASSGEKGPFEMLCEGPVAGGPIGLTLVSEDVEVRVLVHDFAAQASTEPSPTAGWGVPQNAIQLMRTGGHHGPIVVHFTLAATGIGRGWDTVGLAPGVYQNRLEVR